MRVAAVQLNSQADLASNLEVLRGWVAKAAAAGAALVLLPENFAYFGDEVGKRAIAESLVAAEDASDGPIVRCLRELARRHGCWLVAGGMPERSDDPTRPYNTCAVFGPEGDLAARYRKIHLFDVQLGDGAVYRESVATMPGDEPVTVTVPGGRALVVGLSVCYDVRFPELYRRLADMGAELLVVPAAFTVATGKDHWLVLLRARAIESQAFVLAAAQVGRHGERLTFGKSCLVDPWGEVVAQTSEGPGVLVADLDRTYLDAVRRKLPALEHRVLR
ncbi:MAG: carbon-nitrogen hydrolase family protein [Deltaproteobacteria bacterium]|nr:carbon-nitrogen hydrolase family protein [Deltaproteobacteria bacterium]